MSKNQSKSAKRPNGAAGKARRAQVAVEQPVEQLGAIVETARIIQAGDFPVGSTEGKVRAAVDFLQGADENLPTLEPDDSSDTLPASESPDVNPHSDLPSGGTPPEQSAAPATVNAVINVPAVPVRIPKKERTQEVVLEIVRTGLVATESDIAQLRELGQYLVRKNPNRFDPANAGNYTEGTKVVALVLAAASASLATLANLRQLAGEKAYRLGTEYAEFLSDSAKRNALRERIALRSITQTEPAQLPVS